MDFKLSGRWEVESCQSIDNFAQIMCHRALLRLNTDYRVTQNALSEPLGSFEGTFLIASSLVLLSRSIHHSLGTKEMSRHRLATRNASN